MNNVLLTEKFRLHKVAVEVEQFIDSTWEMKVFPNYLFFEKEQGKYFICIDKYVIDAHVHQRHVHILRQLSDYYNCQLIFKERLKDNTLSYMYG